MFFQRNIMNYFSCWRKELSKYFCRSVEQKTLLLSYDVVKGMLRVFHYVLHFIKRPSFYSMLLRFQNTTRFYHYEPVQIVWVNVSEVNIPAADCRWDFSLHNGFRENVQDLSANTEGSKLLLQYSTGCPVYSHQQQYYFCVPAVVHVKLRGIYINLLPPLLLSW